jgi:hypothetical protein
MAVAAGRMAAAAGFFKYLFIEDFQFFFGKPGHHSGSQSRRRIVKRLGIVIRNLFVTGHTGAQIVRRLPDHAFVRSFPAHFLCIALVAENTAHPEMGIFFD